MTQESLLARYKVLHEVGRGATGAVYAARDRTTGAVVALKRLDPALLNDLGPEFIASFLQHARSARALKHRNIVEAFDAGEAGGTPYVAMEMLEDCESLRTILGRGPLPVARAIRIARDVASGLAHAHLQGVMHRGLKPSNVTVLRSGRAKIADFGMGHAMPLDAAGSCPAYMAPEQLRGDPIIDHRCDLYSLGALFYEMLTGRPPFQGKSAKEVLENIARAAPRRPSELNPNVPRVLDAIVCALISAQPGGRMAGMPLLVRELQRIEEGLGLASGPDPEKKEPAPAKPAASPIPPAAPMREVAPMPPVGPTPMPAAAPIPPAAAMRQAAPKPIPAASPMESVGRAAAEQIPPARRPIDREAFDNYAAIAIMEREARARRPSRSQPAIFAAVALAFAGLGIGLAGFLDAGRLADLTSEWLDRGKQLVSETRSTIAPRTLAEASQEPAPVAKRARVAEPAPVAQRAPVAEATPTPVPAAAAVAPPRVVEATPDPVSAPAPVAAAPVSDPVFKATPEPLPAPAPAPAPDPVRAEPPAKQQTRAVQPAAAVEKPQPAGTAKLVVAVSPRGEIYIDGKHHGTTPPVTTLDLEPGMRRIEIRSGSRKPYLTYMTVQPGDERRIRHDFNARPSHPTSPQKLVSTKP